MQIPDPLHDLVQQHVNAGHRVALVVRHAERYPIVDMRTHTQVLLTEAGVLAAHRSGEQLAARLDHDVTLFHSPVERCGQTARALAAGLASSLASRGRHVTMRGAFEGFGTPFLRDDESVAVAATRNMKEFMRAWFEDELPEAWIDKRDPAAGGQVDVVLQALSACTTPVVICVTHDWNIALVREAYLDLMLEERGWPHFLDGYVVVQDEHGAFMTLDGRVRRHAEGPVSRRPRPTR